MRTSTLTLFLGFLAALLIAAPSFAGPLAGNAAAVNGATGSQVTSNGGLNVTVEYAVLTETDFNSQFGGLGYTPTAGELVYAYQVFNNDPPSTVPVTTQIVVPADPANNPGTFNIGDVDTLAQSIVGNQATWSFLFVPVQPGQSSYGLAFSSPNAPVLDLNASLTVGATISASAAVHVPGDSVYLPIPEPATLALAGLAGLALVATRRRR